MELEKHFEIFWVSSVRHTGVTLECVLYSQFLPNISVPMTSLHTVSMMMDREFEEKQIDAHLV